MAEQTHSTDLAVTDGSENTALDMVNETSESQNPDAGEKSSSRFDFASGDLDLIRQIVLVLSIAICVALILMLFFWVKEPEMRPLGVYDTQELIPVLDYLDGQKQDYKLDGNTIMVPASDYNKLKLNLVRNGLNQPDDAGDDIVMKDMGFGVSQRLEVERLKLSRERQLATSIEAMNQVRKARVLLAMPKQSVFVRQNEPASASVFLTLRSGTGLKQSEVDAIVDMVASAVPGMKPNKVTITDQYGRLLSSGSEDAATSAQRKEQQLEAKQEDSLKQKIDSVLIPVLGLGNYTAQVDVQMDFSNVEQTQKRYDPKNPSTRSEYTVEDYNNSNVVGGVPGALSNQPPADSSIPEDVAKMKDGKTLGQGSVHKEATRNFELDTTISHEQKQTGTIARQTVAVAVKSMKEVDPKTGAVTYKPLSDQQLKNIRELLIGAVGFDAQRGDLLNVISMQFAEPQVDQLADVPIWENPNFSDWIRWLASALVIIVIILVLVRPAMKKLINPAAEEEELYGPDGMPIGVDGETSLIGGDIDGGELFEFGSTIDLPNLHKDEDVLKAVRALVANEPELAAQVVKNWMNDA